MYIGTVRRVDQPDHRMVDVARKIQRIDDVQLVGRDAWQRRRRRQRRLVDRQTYKLRRSAALADWQSLAG